MVSLEPVLSPQSAEYLDPGGIRLALQAASERSKQSKMKGRVCCVAYTLSLTVAVVVTLSVAGIVPPDRTTTITSSSSRAPLAGGTPGVTSPVTSKATVTDASTTPAPKVRGKEGEEATTPAPDDNDCQDELEYYNNDELLERLKKIDVAKVLEGLGGAPGKVNATRRADVPESELVGALNITDRPLPDADNETYWLYDYRATDFKTFIRLEHAVLRFKGTPRQFEDARGEVWWTPPNLCGAMRHATYRHDDQGFHAEVLRAHCHIFTGSKTLACYGPDSENECVDYCIFSGVSDSLIATLVG